MIPGLLLLLDAVVCMLSVCMSFSRAYAELLTAIRSNRTGRETDMKRSLRAHAPHNAQTKSTKGHLSRRQIVLNIHVYWNFVL